MCEPGGIRTPNLLIRSQMHYPIMLRVHPALLSGFLVYISNRRKAGAKIIFLLAVMLSFAEKLYSFFLHFRNYKSHFLIELKVRNTIMIHLLS